MSTENKRRFVLSLIGVCLTVSCTFLGCSREESGPDTKDKIAMLWGASKLFTGDATGSFGESPEELKYYGFIEEIPKFVYPDGKEGDFVFIGGFEDHDPGDFAFIASPAVRGSKMRWVATLDRDIQCLPSDEVERLLEKSRQYVKENDRIEEHRKQMRLVIPKWPP